MADSIREALTKAVAEAESVTSTAPTASSAPVDEKVVPTGTEPSTESQAEARESLAANDSGAVPNDPAKAGSAQSSAAAASSPAPDAAATNPSSQQQQGANTNAAGVEQPPASWSAEERKHWTAVPKEAQAAIRRRETEMRRAITAAQEATTHKKQFEQSIERFQPLLKEKGVTDVMGQVVGPLLTMRAGLEIGTPEQKAGLVASIVRDFGIGIEVLDKALSEMAQSGALTAHGAHRPPPAPQFNPRQVPELAPLFQMAERFQQAQQQRAEAAIAEVQQLPDFEDLRGTMADIVENATTNGKQVAILEAYDRARAFHGLEPRVKPQISVSEAASALARSRNAASSVSGAPKSSSEKKSKDLRGQLEAAWSSAQR